MLRSTTQPAAETSSTPPTRTRNSRSLPSKNGFGSRTRPRRSTCRIVGGRIQRCQRSVGSSGDSPPPRQIFTFTHLPLRSPFICHRGIECDDGADLFASSVACPRRGVGDARAHRPGSLHDVGLPVPVRGPSGCGRRLVQRSHPSRLRREPRPPIHGSRRTRRGSDGRVRDDRGCGPGLGSARCLVRPRTPSVRHLPCHARSWPLSAQTAALAVIDSPYSDNVVYSPDSRCLGRISCRDARFYEEMEKVASEAYRVLRFGGILAWIIADEYRGGIYTPVGFRLLGLLARRFEPIDTIVLVRHHDRSASPMWEHRARRFNFFLRGFKFLLLLRKPFDEPGG